MMKRHGLQLNFVYFFIMLMLYAFLSSASISWDLSSDLEIRKLDSKQDLAIQCVDRLQRMVEVVKPVFTQGLVHFNRLIDLILDARISMKQHLVGNNCFPGLLIQRTIYWVFDSFKEATNTTYCHLKRYEDNYLRVVYQIKHTEEMIKNDSALLNNLKSNVSWWDEKCHEFQHKIADFDSKLHDAANRFQKAEKEISKKKKNRSWWIVATVFTVGLATPGLIDNENKLEKVKRDREFFLDRFIENHRLLDEAEKIMESLKAEKLTTESSLKGKEKKLSLLQLSKENLIKQSNSMRKLGEHMKHITTFLSQFGTEVEVLQEQQETCVFLEPLYQLIDSLSEIIGSSSTISLLEEEDILFEIRAKIPILRLEMKK